MRRLGQVRPWVLSGCVAAAGILVSLLLSVTASALAAGGSKVESLTREAEALTAARATYGELARAHLLFLEGEQVLKRDKDVAPDVRYRFFLSGAECARQVADYAAVLRRLQGAQSAAPPADAAALASRVKKVEALAQAWGKAMAAKDKGEAPEALGLFQEIERKYPEAKAHALVRQAQLYTRVQRYAEAVAVERRIADGYKGTPDGEAAVFRMGGTFLRMGQPEKALAAYQESLQIYGDAKDRGLTHYKIGKAYVELGKREEALRELALGRKALRYLEGDARKGMEKQIAEAEAKAKAIKPK